MLPSGLWLSGGLTNAEADKGSIDRARFASTLILIPLQLSLGVRRQPVPCGAHESAENVADDCRPQCRFECACGAAAAAPNPQDAPSRAGSSRSDVACGA